MLTCEQTRMQLGSSERSSAVQAHVDGCPGCREWAHLETRLTALAEERVAAPADLVDVVLQAHRARPRLGRVRASLESTTFHALGDTALRLEHALSVAASLTLSKSLGGVRGPAQRLAQTARRLRRHLVSPITITGQALRWQLGQSEGPQ